MSSPRHARHARRSNLRTAAIAAGVLVGITLPVGAAVADSPTIPTPSPSVSPPTTDVDNGGNGDNGGEWKPGGGGNKPTAPTTPTTDVDNGPAKREAAGSEQLPGGYVAHLYKHVKTGQVQGWEAEVHRVKGGGLATKLKAFGTSDSQKVDGRTFKLSASGQVSSWKDETGGNKPDKPQDQVQTKTISLKDGGVAKVDWILGAPRAELRSRFDKPQGDLEKPGASKVLDSGLKVTLLHGGDLKQEWTGGQGNKPKPQSDGVQTVKLWDGGTAKVSKARTGVWGATLHDRQAAPVDAIEANAKPSAVLKTGLKVTLSKDGKISQEWTGSKPTGQGKPHTVIPKGGVKAGAEGIESDSSTLLAAGGGMAAVGAAGLGFAMLRRNRSQS